MYIELAANQKIELSETIRVDWHTWEPTFYLKLHTLNEEKE